MKRQQLYTLGGVLLASTALSGMAEAAVVGHATAAGAVGFTTTALKIANTIFSTTATSADTVSVGGDTAFVVKFSNSFTASTKFSVEVDVAGAQFNPNAAGDIRVIVGGLTTTGSSFETTTSSAACSAVTPLVSKIIIDGCQLSTATFSSTTGSALDHSAVAGGILLSGVTFNTANSLATVGNSISLSGSVYNTTNPSQSFESITSGAIVTSAAPLTVSITACTNQVANPTATPAAFDYLVSSTANGTLSMCLASVTISSSGALTATLGSAATLATVATSVNVTLTDSVLGSAAVSAVVLTGSASAISSANQTTVANFAGGAATFTVNTTGDASNFTINLTFTGSTPIPAAAAGTVSLAFGKGGVGSAQAVTAASGGTAQISRGGFNSELNTFLTSSNLGFVSYARIHNMGATAGTASVTILNDATGAQLGSTFTTATIAAGQTLQLSNKDLETSAGITAAAGVNYTIQITGPFIGYAQHIIFNPATGQLADLSGFRNHDAGSGNSP